MGRTRSTYRHLQTTLILSVLFCGKSMNLCAGKKPQTLLLELVQSHLLSFVVKVGNSDSKKDNT